MDGYFDLTPDLARPAHTAEMRTLYAGRTRTVLRRSFADGWPGRGRIGLNAPASARRRLEGSGPLNERNRLSIPRVDVVKPEWQEFAPLVGRRQFVPLHVDMIPETSFGASLKNLLTDGCWKSLRGFAFREAGYACESCGEAGGPVECHEVWNYSADGGPAKGWGAQSLVGLLCLCRECHEMFHPGLAGIRGRAQAVAERLMAVNEWTKREHAAWASHADAVHRRRSGRQWSLDLARIAGFGELEISGDWQASGPELRTRNRYGASRTRLVGVGYIHDGRRYGGAS